MNIFFSAVKDGTLKGVKTGLMLLKIILPIYAIVVLIKYSPIMTWLQTFFEPSMELFRLPGNSIVPIITGLFTDEYGVLAAVSSFDYNMAQVTTIAMITLTVHSLPVESVIAQKIGLPPVKIALFRLVLAIIIGLLVGWLGGIFS